MSTACQPGYGLREFVGDVEAVLERRPAMPSIVRDVGASLQRLVRDDRWLDARWRISSPDHYTRHLLHRDAHNRFVVLSLVWLPGQTTPIHDHSCWGLMGLLQNTLEEVHYERLDDGRDATTARLRESRRGICRQGEIAGLLPPWDEIHRIGNVSREPTVSIHVYGRDLDVVNVYDPVTGKVGPMRIKYYSSACGRTPFAI